MAVKLEIHLTSNKKGPLFPHLNRLHPVISTPAIHLTLFSHQSNQDDLLLHEPQNMSIPLVFTLPPSSRHEVILLDTSSKPTLKALNKQITATIASSPNCEECA
jgi:hypothetical protein